jgi:hypothetical protein
MNRCWLLIVPIAAQCQLLDGNLTTKSALAKAIFEPRPEEMVAYIFFLGQKIHGNMPKEFG